VGSLMGTLAAETGPPAGNGDLGAGLAGAVGVVASEAVGLAVAIGPLAVFVDLVSRHHHHSTGVLQRP